MISLKTMINRPFDTFIKGVSKLQRKKTRRRKNIYVSCFPKSGSSFITGILADITGLKSHRVVYQFLRNEQDIYLPSMIDATLFKNFITQQHTRATIPNLRILNYYRIKPIILVRNIFDIVISLRDYLLVAPKMPMAYVSQDYLELSETKQYDFVINFMLPWYFNFYVSWFEAEKNNEIEFKWVKYEDMLDDKIVFFSNILDFLSINKSIKEIEDALRIYNKSDYKFNKGIAGRGMKILTQEQKDKIILFANYYPSVDFTRIGIVKH